MRTNQLKIEGLDRRAPPYGIARRFSGLVMMLVSTHATVMNGRWVSPSWSINKEDFFKFKSYLRAIPMKDEEFEVDDQEKRVTHIPTGNSVVFSIGHPVANTLFKKSIIRANQYGRSISHIEEN